MTTDAAAVAGAPMGAVVRDGHLAARPPAALAPFVAAEVLHAGDVHVAARLAALAGCREAHALLGAAFAVRAPRLGHVCVDLTRVAAQADVAVPDDAAPLDWPDPDGWRDALATSPLVAVGDDDAAVRPLRLVGDLLYLDRYWREERQVAADLRRRAEDRVHAVDLGRLNADLARLFSDGSEEQRIAVASAVLGRLTVVAGGPGTGKTTTIGRLLAVVDAQLPGGIRPRLVALAAPTGKAATRMEEAVHAEAARLSLDGDARARLTALRGLTLHRLLGRVPGSQTRFRHCRENLLPHDLVVVDEASMVSLSLMARLLESLRDDARLVLVGDPDQLASVEAGAVLGDVVGPARSRPVRRPSVSEALTDVLGSLVSAAPAPGELAIGDGITVLTRVHRFGGAIARLAEAIRVGDAGRALATLSAPTDDSLLWLPLDPADADEAALGPLRDPVVAAGLALIGAARAGGAAAALAHLADARILCPHRRGPYGAETWGARVREWLRAHEPLAGAVYPGLPLMVTENDYALGLFNGDTGVVVHRETGPVAAFTSGGRTVELSPRRLAATQPVHAMTVHKSQGSQFHTVGVVVAPAESPISTRELLYTAVTRAQERVIVLGEEEAIRAAVERPVSRASGLRGALWGNWA